ncbi:MAG: hypothetical protein WC389_15865 [Lutibacter sp.]|jgi:hypothetical protein
MGSLTEFFAYLTTEPQKLTELYDELTHIQITPGLKLKQKELTLYKPKKETDRDEQILLLF